MYLALGNNEKQRQAAYRDLFRSELDAEAVADIRLALNQNQALGGARFHRKIEKATGVRREARPRPAAHSGRNWRIRWGSRRVGDMTWWGDGAEAPGSRKI